MKSSHGIITAACTILLSALFLSPVHSDDVGAYYDTLKRLTAGKKFQPALDVSLKAMREYPDQEGFALYAIWSRRELKHFDEAIDMGRAALKKWPASRQIKDNLAWALTGLAAHIIEDKIPRDPLPYAREGYSLNPNDGTMLWFGISLKHRGMPDEAETVLRQGLRKYPNNRYFRPNLVYLYLERGQKARDRNDRKYAGEQFSLAYKTDPSNESALLWYAISQREKKNSAEAVRLFAEGKKIFPRNPYFAENLRWTYTDWAYRLTENNEINEARAVLGRAKAVLPNDPFIISSLAQTYFRRDQKKWEALSREAVSLVPKEKMKTSSVYQMPLASGRIYVHQGNMEPVTHLGIHAGYAWDFVLTDDKNSYGKTWEKKEDHLVFNQPVFAAREGIVHEVYDASPDTEPGKNGPYEVNKILIRHADGEFSYYAHLKKGSALVRQGDAVRKGQRIALVGSSGKYVDFPHLHFQVMRDNLCVETRLNGVEILERGAWRSAGSVTPKKKDVMRPVWSR